MSKQINPLSGRNFYGRKTKRVENGPRVVECKGNLLTMTGISMINPKVFLTHFFYFFVSIKATKIFVVVVVVANRSSVMC